MTTKKALEHFKFKFSKTWKPTKTDIEALNCLIDYVDKTNKQRFRDNDLFAKLYIMVFAQFIDKYKTDIYDDIPQKELHKLINTPIEAFLVRFTERLNKNEAHILMERKGWLKTHPIEDAIDGISYAEDLKNLLPEELAMFEERDWDKDKVTDQLVLQINEVLIGNNKTI